jgi:predicted amidohydrolase
MIVIKKLSNFEVWGSMELIKTALCQITPTFDKTANIEHAISLIKEAASKGAVLVSLPEMFYHPFELLSLRKIAADETDLLQRFSA